MARSLSRRSLLCATAKAVPALAVGGSLLGHSLDLLAAPPKAVGKGAIVGPPGEAKLVTDFTMAPELRILAEATLHKVRAAFATAAAHPTKKFAKNKLTKAAHKFIAAQKTTRITRAQSRASALLSNVPEARAAFGSYAETTASQWQADTGFAAVRERELENNDWAAVDRKIKREKKIKQEKDDSAPKYEKLEFHLNRVDCMETTEGLGSDRIVLGGLLIRPDGIIKSIDPFEVGEFEKGDRSSYATGEGSDPHRGKVLVRTNIDRPWPGAYALLLLMVEADVGGLSDFNTLVSEMNDAVRDELDAAFAGVTTQGLVDIGALPLIIFQVSAWVVTELAQWLSGLLGSDNDLIEAEGWMTMVENRTKAWFDDATAGGLSAPSGQRASAMKELSFTGEPAKYRARLHFRAIA